ncbi:MAG TPA: DUF58 domain-containing protein [Dongiaceae bacterium]|nr:DUF58 domain-containing protein [Dongiaceae bacterium]
MSSVNKLLHERADIAQFRGVYVSMDELVALQGSELRLDLRGKRKSLAGLAGQHRSSFRGRGIDFDEVRIYQPGDDVRNIDWRVTARSGRPHTKLFREERERPVYLVVDQRESLFFGTQKAFKSVVAARTAALLAWASRSHGDRVGGFLFNDSEVQELRPREGKKGIQHFFRVLAQFNQSLTGERKRLEFSRHALTHSMRHLNQVVRPGSLVFLISDFLHFEAETLQHMTLCSRHNDLVGIQIQDPLEKQLPHSGTYGFTDGQRNVRIDTSVRNVRKDYALNYVERQTELREQLGGIGVPLLEIGTGDVITDRLQAALGLKAGVGLRS